MVSAPDSRFLSAQVALAIHLHPLLLSNGPSKLPPVLPDRLFLCTIRPSRCWFFVQLGLIAGWRCPELRPSGVLLLFRPLPTLLSLLSAVFSHWPHFPAGLLIFCSRFQIQAIMGPSSCWKFPIFPFWLGILVYIGFAYLSKITREQTSFLQWGGLCKGAAVGLI